MKKAIAILMLSLAAVTVSAQKNQVKYNFTEASDLTMVGKLMTDTPNPYHRVDTVRFNGFTVNTGGLAARGNDFVHKGRRSVALGGVRQEA